jgi:hypothetical protein
MSDYLTLAAILALSAGLVYGCTMSDWAKREEAERHAQERADATPHVIREADGCKVYAWKGDGWHYFTKCPNSTVQTDRHYTEQCGKGCTRNKVESITTTTN